MTETALGRSAKMADTIPMKDRTENLSPRNRTDRPGRMSHTASIDEGKKPTSIQPRASSRINDNYCVTKPQAQLLAGTTPKEALTVQSLKRHVKLNVVNHIPSATGHPQRKGISPGLSGVMKKDCTLKYVKGVSSVTQLSCAQPVTNVPLAVQNLPVGARLQIFLAKLARNGCRSENSSNPERGLHPPLSDLVKSHEVSHGHKLLCQSSQEQLPDGGITSAYRQKCHRSGSQPDLPRVFQPAVFGTQAQQQVETHTGPKQTESVPQSGEIQNGDTRNHQNVPPAKGVGHLYRFEGCLLPHPNTGTIQEISKISCPGPDIPIQSTPFWSVHSAFGVHCNSKGGETDGHTHGYKNPPVPRRLAGTGHLPPRLSPTYSNTGQDVPRPRLDGECREIRTRTQASLRLCRLPVRPLVRPGTTHTGPLAKPSRENSKTAGATGLSGPAVHVLDRFVNSHRKTSSPRPTAHETHTVAPQKQLEDTGILREGHSNTQVSAPTFTMVAGGGQCAPRSTITPNKTCSANLYRCIKRRVGLLLSQAHCKRGMVITGKQAAYTLSGTESSIPGSKRVPRPLLGQDSPGSNRQHNGSGLCKQGRRHEVGPTLCPIVENLDLVYQETSDSQGPTHPRSPKCSSRQTIQTGSDHPDRMVSPSRSFPNLMQQVAPASNRPIRHEVQQQVASICVTSTRPPGNSSRCSQSAMGGSGRVRLPTDRHIGQSGGEVTGLPIQENHPDCSGVAQHALVLGT